MTTSKQSETDLARVEVSIVGPTIWIIVKLETETWPFTIENASDYAVEFSQTVRSLAGPGLLSDIVLLGRSAECLR